MARCKFEHGGYCCNCGAMQHMDKCEKPCDTIEPITNADRIRAMSDEELAEFVQYGSCPYIEEECTMKGCVKCILDWLKQPVKDGEDDEKNT